MSEQRGDSTLKVSPQTTREKLGGLAVMIIEDVSTHAAIRFVRAYFQKFAEGAQIRELVYYGPSADIGPHMERPHEVNLALHKRFLREASGIDGSGRPEAKAA